MKLPKTKVKPAGQFPSLLALIAIPLTLSSCSLTESERSKIDSSGGSKTTLTTSDTRVDKSLPVPNQSKSATKASALPVVNSPYPGPYHTVIIAGAEMLQGRFPPGEYGGSLLRSILSANPKTFNYWASNDATSSDLASLMFHGLVTIDQYTGKVIPAMAESFKIEPDGRTYITKLRKGLQWSDGKPITAEDVSFTWNIIIKGGYGNSSLRDVSTIDGKFPEVTAIDQFTNKYVTPKTFAPFSRLIGFPIAPKHVIEPLISGTDGRKAFDRLWSVNLDPKTLVTSGPFVLRRYVPAQRVEFTRSSNYYMVNKAGKKLPYFSNITYLIVPDPNTDLLKFRAREIDITGVRARDVVQLMPVRQQENFRLYNLGPSTGTRFLMFNMNRRKNPGTGKQYVDPIKSAWFNDVNFRQAVNHAINRDQLVSNYFRGIGAPLFTAEPEAHLFHDSSLKGFKQDIPYCSSLLEKSGFKKKADSSLYDKENHRVEFNLLYSSGSTFTEAAANLLKKDLTKLGMKVNLQQLDFNVLNDKTSNSLNWDAVLMALTGDPLEPHDGANVFKSSGRLHMFDLRVPDASGNVAVTDARPWEKRLDEIFDKGAETLDINKRKQFYNEYQKIIYDQAPFIYLVSSVSIVAARNTLHNYEPTQLSQSSMGLHNLEEIWKK